MERQKQVNLGKGDPKEPGGRTSSRAFLVQTCREEHKKKHPDSSANFSELSKKCSERWKTMSAKEKGTLEDMAKADKAQSAKEKGTFEDMAKADKAQKKAADLKEKYEKDIAAYRAKGKPDAAKKGVVKAEKSKKKKEEEEDEEGEEEEEDEEDEDEE
ncbi:High mobility group protein B1 [Heterocephalus glaber]|uniref:High mobility group protein B1 n=1 Tax=Heterocephalus glaber TaxID=10181 RepID=G5BNH6_HETGA|nr:High mobility group protein B1 [Heterocephalus glaber]